MVTGYSRVVNSGVTSYSFAQLRGEARPPPLGSRTCFFEVVGQPGLERRRRAGLAAAVRMRSADTRETICCFGQTADTPQQRWTGPRLPDMEAVWRRLLGAADFKTV